MGNAIANADTEELGTIFVDHDPAVNARNKGISRAEIGQSTAGTKDFGFAAIFNTDDF